MSSYKKDIKVSIIIPFYNVEKYIGRCIDSIINQTYRNLEIIMVNDGSPDSCRDIIISQMKKDIRIKLIDRENGGLSAARNTGLDHATGEYIIFVDSDDWAETTFVEKLLDNITYYDSDMACCRLRYVDLDNNKTTIYGKPYEISYLNNKEDIIQDALSVKNIHTPVWAKIYKSDFLKRAHLTFYEGIVNEDTLFTSLCTLYADKVSFVNEVLFNSLERPGSISRSSQERLFRDMHFVLTEFEQFVSSNDFKVFPNLIKHIRMRYVRAMLYNLLQSAQRLDWKKFQQMHRLCITKTNYRNFGNVVKEMPLKYRLMYNLSKSAKLFWGGYKVLNKFGFRMH